VTDPVVREALARWGLEDAGCEFVAGRENRVFRVRGAQGDFALRVRRPGYRSRAELRSELDWLAAMDRAGLSVPRPRPSRSGALIEQVDDNEVDLVGWLPGRRLADGPLPGADAAPLFERLGAEIARLHLACDRWRPPPGFVRVRWDADGLLGEAPLWGRFWENPTLDADTRELLVRFRGAARRALDAHAGALDHGLIHADLVRDNLLLDGDRIRLLDFDDGGFGYRLFDLATVLVKAVDPSARDALGAALLAGYRALRPLDDRCMALCLALRATTYVGWIVPRMGEARAAERNARFVADARALCGAYLRGAGAA
jgi:Ser/Thr protein kinase RdoA (MazF antagonist)